MPATFVKLTEAGSSLTLSIRQVAMATTGKWPGVIFTGLEEGSGQLLSIEVPKSASDRQLSRMGITMDMAEGRDLTFSRDPSPSGAPYWGISFAEPANLPATAPHSSMVGQHSPPQSTQRPPAAPQSHDPPPPDDRDAPPSPNPALDRFNRLAAVHRACFKHSLGLGVLASEAGVEVTLEGLSALTAQLLIAFNDGH